MRVDREDSARRALAVRAVRLALGSTPSPHATVNLFAIVIELFNRRIV
jgi:hypothetical protein